MFQCRVVFGRATIVVPWYWTRGLLRPADNAFEFSRKSCQLSAAVKPPKLIATACTECSLASSVQGSWAAACPVSSCGVSFFKSMFGFDVRGEAPDAHLRRRLLEACIRELAFIPISVPSPFHSQFLNPLTRAALDGNVASIKSLLAAGHRPFAVFVRITELARSFFQICEGNTI